MTSRVLDGRRAVGDMGMEQRCWFAGTDSETGNFPSSFIDDRLPQCAIGG
jgi:hypothetical protein